MGIESLRGGTGGGTELSMRGGGGGGSVTRMQTSNEETHSFCCRRLGGRGGGLGRSSSSSGMLAHIVVALLCPGLEPKSETIKHCDQIHLEYIFYLLQDLLTGKCLPEERQRREPHLKRHCGLWCEVVSGVCWG